jgi:hypothetical protein
LLLLLLLLLLLSLLLLRLELFGESTAMASLAVTRAGVVVRRVCVRGVADAWRRSSPTEPYVQTKVMWWSIVDELYR